MVDALGRPVLEVAATGGADLPLHLRGQVPGVYLLSVETAAGVARQALVVQ
ncbi:hypothetical protein [Hymenobacter persicinus]|uniref:hypothetical protein n=1 Tax=Hymenobacter persicinus TaxID=2025506 RepID=UPI001F5C6128|nr:hypothetical protein [Hymenobacter persicinus]